MNLPGVTPNLFTHPSDIHGAEHVNRVICLGQLLLTLLEKSQPGTHKRWSKTLWAACYLHDLARRHDDICHDHGIWAVEEKLPDLLEFFVKTGVTPSDAVAIATAVEWHSIPEELAVEHPHWFLTALLKDADALDRVRLGGPECIDPCFLRFKESRRLIPLTKPFFEATQDSMTARSKNLNRLWEILNFLADQLHSQP